MNNIHPTFDSTDSKEIILRGPEPLYEPAKGGLGYEIHKTLTLNKGKIAQVIISNGHTNTYDDLLQNSTKVAIYLSKKNLEKEDIVFLVSENTEYSLIPLIAAKFVGLNYVSLEPTVTKEDFLKCVTYFQPKIVFASEKNERLIETYVQESSFKGEIIILGKSTKFTDISVLLRFSELENNFQPVFIENIKEDAIIFLSSGTTGSPKAICISHYSLLGQLFNIQKTWVNKGTIHFSNYYQTFDDTENLKFMFYSPINWISHIAITLMMLFCGGASIIGTTFSAKEVWHSLKKYKPNILFLAPGQVNAICSYASDKEPDDTLDLFLTGGSLVTKEHIQFLRRCFRKSIAVQGYGQTENATLTCNFDLSSNEEFETMKNHPDSCGRPLPGVQIKIVDPNRETICGVGEQGELRLKSKYMMNGYYKMDSSSDFDSDGWFKSGDLAYFDENHCIYIVNRIKDLIRHTFYDINPSVIEKILCRHPAIYESVVIGYPHPEDNEHPMGVVVLKNEYKNNVNQDEIISFVNERVPSDRYKIRAGIKFVDELVKTKTGKPNKVRMKHLIKTGQL